MEQAGVALIAQGAAAYDADMKRATGATNTFVDSTEKGGGRVSAAGQVMIGALRKVGDIAVSALAQAAKATAAFVGDSIGLAGDFEAGMHKFQAVAGDAVDTKGLEKFKDLFLDLGKELPVSTSEVEKAAIEMVSGGIDPAIVAGGALRTTIQFAAAAGLDLADAAATSAKFLAGWTSSAATTEEKVAFLALSTDTLTKAAAASSTTAKELRLGLFNVQGAAQALHVSFEDTTASLALLAPAFESSAQAGTALNVFMTRLVPQTDKAKDKMHELGIITKDNQSLFFDTQGNFLGMANAAQVLKEKLGGMTDEQKIANLHELFGNDGMKVGNLLLADGAAAIDTMKAKMNAANGVAATAALMQSGYNTALENAKGSVEAFQIKIGSALLPMLTDLLNNYIAPGVNMVSDFAESFLKMVPAIAASDDPLQSFLNAMKIAAPGLFDFIVAIEDIKDAITPTVQEIMHLADAFSEGGLGGLIDAVVGDIEASIPDIEAALGEWGQAFVDWMVDIAPDIKAQLDTWAQAFVDWVITSTPLMFQALDDLIGQAQAWIVEQAPGWREQLLAWGAEFAAWVPAAIPPALAELNRLGDAFLGWIGAQAAPLITRFNDWATAFIAWIPGATVNFLAEWPGMLDKFLDWIGNAAGPLLKQLGDWALSFIGWILPMIPPFLVALGGIALAVGTFVVETAAVLTKKIVEKWVPAILGWIVTDAIPKLYVALNDFLEVFQGWITEAQNKLAGWFREVGKEIVEGIKSGLSFAWGSLTSWITDHMQETVDAGKKALGISSPSKAFAEIGKFSVQGIIQGWTTTLPQLTSQVAGLGSSMMEAFDDTDLIDGLTELGENVMNGFAEGMQRGFQGVIHDIDDIADDMEERFQQATQTNSPSWMMVPIGAGLMEGIALGMVQGWPGLSAQIDSIADDLIGKMADIGDQIQGLIADSFGGRASIDRQMAKNLDSFKDVLPEYMQYTQGALAQAQKQAEAFLDPTEGARFFQARSKQIFEYAKLQKDLAGQQIAANDATLDQQKEMIKSDQLRAQLAVAATDKEREAILEKLAASQLAQDADIAARREALATIDRLKQQMLLINAAQSAEVAQGEAQRAGSGSATDSVTGSINDLLKLLGDPDLKITDEQIQWVNQLASWLATLGGAPARRAAGGPVDANMPYWVGEKGPELFTPGTNGMISPAASSQQLAARANTTNYNGQVGPTINMPIYTNNTVGAIQQSWAVMQASMP